MSKVIINQAFKSMLENYTPVNVIQYIDIIREQSLEDILECSENIFSEPTRGASFMQAVYEKESMSHQDLGSQKEKLEAYLSRKKSEGYTNDEHINIIESSIFTLENRIFNSSQPDALYESTVQYFEDQQQKLIDRALTILSENQNEETVTAMNTIRENVSVYDGGSKLKYMKESIMEMAPDIIASEDENTTDAVQVVGPTWTTSFINRVDKEYCETEFSKQFAKTFMSDSPDLNLESFNRMMYAAYEYDQILEKMGPVANAARNIARAGDRATQGLAKGARKTGSATKRVAVVAKKIPGNIDNLINNTLGAIKKMDQSERRAKILEGGFKVKLFRILRLAITSGSAAAWVHPALGAITLLTSVAVDKSLDRNARKRLLNELEHELQIVDEKIEDAKGAGDREQKYQLMRIRHKLGDDLNRIKYNLSV